MSGTILPRTFHRLKELHSLGSEDPPSLLDRGDSSRSPLTENQALVDQMISSFVSEAAKGSTLLSMLGAGVVSRLTRIGVMSAGSLQEGKVLLPLFAKGGSYALALANESAAFAGIERGMARWQGHPSTQSFGRSWVNSAVSLGSLKIFGALGEGSNILVRHILADLGMVAAQNGAFALGIGDKPQGNFIQRMAEAEIMNFSMEGSAALLHGLSPGLLAIQRSLDLYIKDQETNLFSRRQSTPFFSRLAAEGTEIFSIRSGEVEKMEQATLILEMSSNKEGKRGSKKGKGIGGMSDEELDSMIWRALTDTPRMNRGQRHKFQAAISARFQSHGGEKGYLEFLGENPRSADDMDVEYLGRELIGIRLEIDIRGDKSAQQAIEFEEKWGVFHRILKAYSERPAKRDLMKKIDGYFTSMVQKFSDVAFIGFLEEALKVAAKKASDPFPLLSLLFNIQDDHPRSEIRKEAERVLGSFFDTEKSHLTSMGQVVQSWGPDRFRREVTAAVERNDIVLTATLIASLASLEGREQPVFTAALLSHPDPLIRFYVYDFLQHSEPPLAQSFWEAVWASEKLFNIESLSYRNEFFQRIVDLLARHGIVEAQRLLLLLRSQA